LPLTHTHTTQTSFFSVSLSFSFYSFFFFYTQPPPDPTLLTSTLEAPPPLPSDMLEPPTAAKLTLGGDAAATSSDATAAASRKRGRDDSEGENDDDDDDGDGDGDGDGDDGACETTASGARMLNYARKCHVCHTPFRELHHFYDQMCPPCATLNWDKRHATADLAGKTVLVTGSRVKIGFEITLSLLRCGAHVIGLTRFPRDAAIRFSQVPDFLEWSARLEIVGLDLRDLPAVHRFCDKLKATHDRLDAIINNAAQTVRKPPAFYSHLLSTETTPLPEKLESMIHAFDHVSGPHCLPSSVRSTLQVTESGEAPEQEQKQGQQKQQSDAADSAAADSAADSAKPGGSSSSSSSSAPSSGVARSAALSLLPLAPGDTNAAEHHFPPGRYDEDMQQVDLRTTNSWVQRLGEVCTVELLEVHAINTFAPWIINSELKPLLERTAGNKFIVNVSAQEGSFYKSKTIYHPQTNMAKAALNMMTRTSGADYAQSSIYMTCVDTGWITDERPAGDAPVRERGCPLDLIDAAMRCLDPVYLGYNGGKLHYGVFLKDYAVSRW
jgi:NAD(P)-dependent dehydrogenase (short-subunit alcohol dehydrogenase family)